jgi:hypothetical protein
MRFVRCLVVDGWQQLLLDKGADGGRGAAVCGHPVLQSHLHHAARVAVDAPHRHFLDVLAQHQRGALQHASLRADAVLHIDAHDLQQALQLRADHLVVRGALLAGVFVLERDHPLFRQVVVVVVVGLAQESVQRGVQLLQQVISFVSADIASYTILL